MFVRKNYGVLIALLLLKIVLQYCIVSPQYEPHRDEYLHLDLANHMAWGYLSVPPFSALIGLFIQWLGNGVWAIRLFPALFGALTLLVVWELVAALGGRLYAQLLAASAVLFSAMLRVNMLFMPNAFDVLTWTLTYYALVRYIQTGKLKWMIWLGVAVGLGFMNKYNILFLVAGLVPALLLTPQRKVLYTRHMVYGVLVALVIVMPNLLWQVRHGFPVLHHMHELREEQLVNVKPVNFLLFQCLFFLGSIFLWIGALVALFRYAPFRPYRAVGWSYFIVIGIYLYLHGKDYYAIGLYPALLAFGAVYFEQLFSAGRARYFRVVWVVIPFAVIAWLSSAIFPIASPQRIQRNNQRLRNLGLLRWEDGKEHLLPQDFADMQGWREMADIVLATYQHLPDTAKPHTLIICGNYGQAGALNYFNHGKMPEALSFNADYVYWILEMDTLTYVILLDDTPDEVARRVAGRIVKQGEVTNIYAREKGTGVFLLSELQPGTLAGLRKMARAKIAEYESAGR